MKFSERAIWLAMNSPLILGWNLAELWVERDVILQQFEEGKE